MASSSAGPQRRSRPRSQLAEPYPRSGQQQREDKIPSKQVAANGEATILKETLVSDSTSKYEVVAKAPVSFAAALEKMAATEEPFMEHFLDTLRSSKYCAYFFETPALTGERAAETPFEFVLVNAPSLARLSLQPDPYTFQDQMQHAGLQGVVDFPSLGGDSHLVVPSQTYPETAVYTHLASFSRYAPLSQQRELWRRAANVLLEKLALHPIKPYWLSTSGLGVVWLHVRVDTRPKYYTHRAYKRTLIRK